MKTTYAIATALLASLPLLACSKPPAAPAPPAAGQSAAPQTVFGKAADSAIAKAREELASGNITLGHNININGHDLGDGPDGRPKAEITPRGDFLIDGQPIAISPAQRALLLQYRHNVIDIADTGMAIGVKGADLAGKAMKEALFGVITGNTDKVEQKLEGEAKALEADAQRLCQHLPTLLATQGKLADALPEFVPYATMTQKDIDDCGKEDSMSDAERARVRDEIRDGIRESIRGSVRGAVQATASNETTEAAQATDMAKPTTSNQ
ncbi:YggN family protein [Lysobacter sp. CFH 32150]|uniref:YggN family protein n=1 Tax=Lysobacter sp. CFH 32150 TaxID=2927128 RepID=UPI001FA7E432|nr:YggN family protein [Lysobacter sp. CFH 32150]MCI4567134.1 YggN family protein [Lysobacter sp. CFH 32150]